MSTPDGPGQPNEQQPEWQYPAQQYEPYIYQQPPGADQLPPYAGPAYGTQPQYGYSGYPQTGPQRPSNRTPLIIVAIAVVVVALAVVGFTVLTGSDDTKKTAQLPPSSSSAFAPGTAASKSVVPASPTPSGNLSPTTVQQISVPPVVSGWQGVLSYKDNVAYDVPPGWKVETPGTLVGFEGNDGQPLAIMHGVSTYEDDACPGVSGSYRGHVGFKTAAGDVDLGTTARGGLSLFADGVALRDDGSSAPVSRATVKTIMVDQGKIRATYARATVTLNDKTDCGSPSVVVVAVSFRSGPSTVALFIGYFDQGVSDALPLTTAEKIFTALRPYQK